MRFGFLGPWLALGSLAVAAPASAQQYVNFIACPVAQDTGDRSDVCFFVMHEGVRYGVSLPIDWGNPQLGQRRGPGMWRCAHRRARIGSAGALAGM